MAAARGRPVFLARRAILAARRIAELWPGQKIQLGLSGGVDSAAMAEAFRAAEIPFEAVVLRMRENYNFHDIAEAQIECRRAGIPVKIIDVDARAFLESSLLPLYADRYQCGSPMLCLHLWLLDQCDGVPVFCGESA